MKTYWLLDHDGRKPLVKPVMPAMQATPQPEIIKTPEPQIPSPQKPVANQNSVKNTLNSNLNSTNSLPKPNNNSIIDTNKNLTNMNGSINQADMSRRSSSYSPVTFQDVARRSVSNSPVKLNNSNRRGKYSWVKWDQFWK